MPARTVVSEVTKIKEAYWTIYVKKIRHPDFPLHVLKIITQHKQAGIQLTVENVQTLKKLIQKKLKNHILVQIPNERLILLQLLRDLQTC